MLSLVNRSFFQYLTIISICFRPINAQTGDTNLPEVEIPQGTLRGATVATNHGRNISAFLGIPYGQPPIGNLRFASPVNASGWDGIRDASSNGNLCPQISENVIVGEEDCLYLNVYTPRLPESENSSSLLPVMVFIHGGAFISGSASSTRFGPEYLLDEDIVFVAPNYRLGPLGFLSTGDEVAPGNWALKDQVLALRWVQENVKYFGGDRNQVTLFGQSAGSSSVHLLTLSKSTVGLFHRYITQSGTALAKWSHQPRAAYSRRAFDLGEFVGCNNVTSESLINCLRQVNYTDILATATQFLVWQDHPTIVWFPTDEPDIEGALLTDSPTNLFTSEGIRDLPWISGVVRDEGLMFSAAFFEDPESFDDLLANIDIVLPEMLSLTFQPDSGAAWVEALKSYYFNNDFTTNRSELLSNFTTLIGDALFLYPAHDAVQRQLALAKSPEYFYTFNYRGTYSVSYSYSGGSTTNYGVAHGDDNLYLYSPSIRFASLNETVSETDLQMVNTMVELWTSFAINGTPKTSTSRNDTTWQPFSTNDNYLIIGNETHIELEMRESFFAERMQFWAKLNSRSGSVSLQPNLLFTILLVCLKFVPER